MPDSLDKLKALAQSLYRVKSRAEYLDVTRVLLSAIDTARMEASEVDRQLYTLTKENAQLKKEVRTHNVLTETREKYKICEFAPGGFYLGLIRPSDTYFSKICANCFEAGSISPLHHQPPHHYCIGCNSRLRSDE